MTSRIGRRKDRRVEAQVARIASGVQAFWVAYGMPCPVLNEDQRFGLIALRDSSCTVQAGLPISYLVQKAKILLDPFKSHRCFSLCPLCTDERFLFQSVVAWLHDLAESDANA